MSHKPYSLSVKIAIKDNDGRYLFLRRSQTSTWNPGRWEFPGGKLQPGETFQEAIHREVGEETGFEIELIRMLGAVEDETNGFRIVHLIMEGKIESGDVVISSEHDKFEWVKWSDIDNYPLCKYILDFSSFYDIGL
ncbi:MAG: NUDIX domain-containing protein [bacterium]|nr:NUDIX domain-containing protein [bacterium]